MLSVGLPFCHVAAMLPAFNCPAFSHLVLSMHSSWAHQCVRLFLFNYYLWAIWNWFLNYSRICYCIFSIQGLNLPISCFGAASVITLSSVPAISHLIRILLLLLLCFLLLLLLLLFLHILWQQLAVDCYTRSLVCPPVHQLKFYAF